MTPTELDLKDWLAPSRTALLLIDMQRDFASPDGALGQAGFDMTAPLAAVAKAQRLADAARAAQVPCFFVRLITRPQDESRVMREDRLRRGHAGAPLCRQGTPGAEFVGPRPMGGEYVVSKPRTSGFTATRLDETLRAEGRDTLLLCGLTTECCIDSTARDGFERDYHVFIATDAVAAYAPELHEAALKALELTFARLTQVDRVIATWNS